MVNKYYQKQNQIIGKGAHEKYRCLYKEEKDKQRKKFWDRYKDLPEARKQKLCEYMKKYYLAYKNQLLGFFKDPREIRFVSGKSHWNTEQILKFFDRFKDFVTTKKFFEFFIWLSQVITFPNTEITLRNGKIVSRNNPSMRFTIVQIPIVRMRISKWSSKDFLILIIRFYA